MHAWYTPTRNPSYRPHSASAEAGHTIPRAPSDLGVFACAYLSPFLARNGGISVTFDLWLTPIHLERIFIHERSTGRHGPLELDLSPRLVEGDAGYADARMRHRDGAEHAQRGVESPVKPSPVTKFSHWILKQAGAHVQTRTYRENNEYPPVDFSEPLSRRGERVGSSEPIDI